jgi:type VI secretion system protein ImpL
MLSLLKRPLVVAVIGLTLVALFVWFVGPYFSFGFGDAVVQPFASDAVRLVVIGSVVLVWALSRLLKRLKSRRASDRLMAAVVKPSASEVARPSAEAVVLRERFEEAVAALKQRKRGSQTLYDLPWYLIIGAPGSGKTTALVNSGLKFPVEQRTGKGALRGVGGTRNCDWWFTDEAVFLDTAGRYTTQDSDADSDSAGWAEFLALLKQYRGRRPLNGVMVTISAQDLLLQRSAGRESHVAAVRRRLEELERELKVQLPVYLLVTKCDLVAGFNEYFDDLTPEGRTQVWGTTFPYERTLDGTGVRVLPVELDALVERLNARVFDRLQAESDVIRRTRIFAFPQQMASLRDPLTEFVSEVFASTRFDRQMRLRGVYFTSGTQEGTPIDRLLGALIRRSALAPEAVPAGRGKAYFIQSLLRDVMFAESGLAGMNRRGEVRLAAWQLATYAAMLVVTVLGVVVFVVSYSRNRSYLSDVSAQLEQLRQTPAPGPQASLESVLPRLDAVRAVWSGATGHRATGTLSMRAGLYQGGTIGDEAWDAYARELDGTLLPRVAARIENRLRVDVPEPEQLYEYLKAYLMLGQPEHFDREQVSYIAREEWERATDVETAEALAKHFGSLLTGEAHTRPVTLDATLVAQARSTIRQATIPQLVYRQLRLRYLDEGQRPLRLDVAAGVGSQRVLRLKSGRALSEPVPNLYTAGVFKGLTGRNTEEIAKEFDNDRWVWGDQGQPVVRSSTLVAAVTDIYENDYIAYWDAVLKDIDVVPLGTLERTKEALEILSRPTSPLRGLLKAVDEQTHLVKTPDAAAAPSVPDRLGSVFRKGKEKLGLPTRVPGQKVTDYFDWLHRLVTGEGGNAPIDAVVRRLEELQKKVGAIGERVGDVNPASAAAIGDATQTVDSLNDDARHLPPVVGTVLSKIASGTGAAVRGGASQSLASRYNANVAPQCSALISKYPFNPSSQEDVPLEDFGKLLGPGGVFDQFFRDEMSSLVDTARDEWTWRRDKSGATVGGDVPLRRFQAAKRIRDIFFRSGGAQPAVSFTMTPFELDETVRRVSLDVHGKTFEYAHGPERTTQVLWPGERPGGPATVSFTELSGASQAITQSGPWALWRLLDGAAVTRDAGSDVRYLLTLEKAGRKAQFHLDASSIYNPFADKSLLPSFRCS